MAEAGIDNAVSFSERLVVNGVCRDGESVLVPMIRYSLKHGNPSGPRTLFEKFTKDLGVQPKLLAYNLLIGGLLEADMIEVAEGLFLEMKSTSCIPDVATYNFLLDAYGKSGKLEELFEMYKEMSSHECTEHNHSQHCHLRVSESWECG